MPRERGAEPHPDIEKDQCQNALPRKEAIEAVRAGSPDRCTRDIDQHARQPRKSDPLNHEIPPDAVYLMADAFSMGTARHGVLSLVGPAAGDDVRENMGCIISSFYRYGIIL
jgi:hypothetical protein